MLFRSSDVDLGASSYVINFPEGETTSDVEIDVVIPASALRAYPSILIGGLSWFGAETRNTDGFRSVELDKYFHTTQFVPKISFIY